MPGVKRTISTPKILTPTVQEVRQFALKHTDTFIQNQLKLVDKVAGVLPFKYNWSQRRIAAIIKEEEKAGRPIRLFILKSRQIGSSTMIAARFFVQTWAHDNLEALVLSQLEDRSEELLQRVKFMYSNLHPSLKLALSADSKAGIQYADTRAKITILSARNRDAAKGGTKQRVLLSEWSIYKDPTGVLVEFLQPVEHAVGTEIVIETTGANYGGDAHNYWRKCRAGRTPFRPIFLAWQEDPTCDYIFESERDRDYKLAQAFEYEPRLKDRMRHHKLTAGQIYYSFNVLFNKCNGDYEGKYMLYYPCTEDEAWRSTGNSYFGTENVNILSRQCDDYEAELFVWGGKTPIDEEFDKIDDLQKVTKLTDGENGSQSFLKVWKRPHPKGDYVISGDSAQGLEDGNFCSSFIVDKNTYEMIAEFHGRCRPDQHAKVMASLGYIYNTAMLAPEYNAPGNITLFELQRMSYPNIYRWRKMDAYKPSESNYLGWETNHKSRPLMLGLAKRLVEDMAGGRVRDMKGIIKSQELCNEMMQFKMNDEGKPEAANNANDDRVMAWGICIYTGMQDAYGTDHDILSLYKDQDPEYKANVVDLGNTMDPNDVIKKLSTPKFTRTWAGDGYGN